MLAKVPLTVLCFECEFHRPAPWSKTADYWTISWEVTAAVKKEFNAAGISIPFPQQDVHVHQVSG